MEEPRRASNTQVRIPNSLELAWIMLLCQACDRLVTTADVMVNLELLLRSITDAASHEYKSV